MISVLSHTNTPPSTLKHDSLLDVLIEWGCTYMWDSMVIVGKYDWIEKAIANRSCLAVTNGSYMRELYPNVCSTALIFECTDGTGRLIGFKETPHKIWERRLENEGTRLLHIKGEVMDVYKPLQVGCYATTSNRWKRVQIDTPTANVVQYCTIR